MIKIVFNKFAKLWKIIQEIKELEETEMAQNISITQAGRRYLQLYNMPVQPIQRNSHPPDLSLPSMSQSSQCRQPRQVELHSLPFRLNSLYKTNTIINEAKAELNHNISKIRKDLLKDLGYSNEYTNRRANELVAKIVGEKIRNKGELLRGNCQRNQWGHESKAEGKENVANVGMELSKSKNYLARINYLHCQSKNRFENIKKQIQKATQRESLD